MPDHTAPPQTTLDHSDHSGRESRTTSAETSRSDDKNKCVVDPRTLNLDSTLTLDALVLHLSLSKKFIQRLKKYGLLPVVMVGFRPRYRYGDVLEAMRAKNEKRKSK